MSKETKQPEKRSSKQTLPPYTYYYGFTKEQIIALANMRYKQALEYKISSAKALLQRCVNMSFMEQDTARMNDIAKSIKFNEELLTELKY